MSYRNQSSGGWQQNNAMSLPDGLSQILQQTLRDSFGQDAAVPSGGGYFPNNGGSYGQQQPGIGYNAAAFEQNGNGGGNSWNNAAGGGQTQHYDSIGIVTKIRNDCGLVNDEVFFNRNVCKGRLPNVGDRVLFESDASTSGQFRWNAIRIQVMPQEPQPLMGIGGMGSSDYNYRRNEYQRDRRDRRENNQRSQVRNEAERKRKNQDNSSTGKRTKNDPKQNSGPNKKPGAKNEPKQNSGAAKKPGTGTQQMPASNAPKSKSESGLWKSRYNKAMFILSKIAKNEKEGTVHDFDQTDKVKYQKVIDEYMEYKAAAQKAAKQDSPQVEASPVSKKDKAAKQTKPAAKPLAKPKKPVTVVVRDELQVALIDENTNNGKSVLEIWPEIESKLAELVMEHLLSDDSASPSGFDSSEVFRGCRIFKCDNEASKGFLTDCIAQISDDWEGLSLKLIPAVEVQNRSKARIWLPNVTMESEKVLQVLQRQNPEIPMSDWRVIKTETIKKSSTAFVLSISEQSVDALKKVDCKLRFGVRCIRINILKASDDDDEVQVEKEKAELPKEEALDTPSEETTTEVLETPSE